MNPAIKNINDLQTEIQRLRLLRDAQGAAIKARFSSPSTTFSTIFSVFVPEGSRAIFKQDLFGLLSRILLPVTLNKTVFRNSGFLVKGLVSLVSQKASNYISEDSIIAAWDKVKSIFTKKHKEEDYGIPPESEAS
jgi:hypothetical protein